MEANRGTVPVHAMIFRLLSEPAAQMQTPPALRCLSGHTLRAKRKLGVKICNQICKLVSPVLDIGDGCNPWQAKRREIHALAAGCEEYGHGISSVVLYFPQVIQAALHV